MQNKTIGIVGQGFVGKAVREKLKEDFTIYAYDKYNEDLSRIYSGNSDSRGNINLSDIIKMSDVVFVCVPTPMYEDGQCDTRIVESVINDIHLECVNQDKTTVVICKSTMPPGTTDKLNTLSPLVDVLFSPEFLTEANSVQDFKNQNRIVLGTTDTSIATIDLIRDIFKVSFPEAEIIVMNATEAETVKYVANLYLATKVSFFNDMYDFCNLIGSNYDTVINAVTKDPRISKSHTMVPGPDGDRGFGGHCFPGTYSIKTTKGDITLKEAFFKYSNNQLIEVISFDDKVENQESKIVNEVTRNHYKGNLIKFSLEDGSVLECTPEHIFPINRNNKLILIKAKDILESDNFYSVSEYINKNRETLTYDTQII